MTFIKQPAMSKKGPIILVEDDKDDQELIKEILRSIGILNKLVCFSNGSEALDYLKTSIEQPFLILSDVNMPVMDGITLRKYINENERLRKKSIPFVFLTTTAGMPAVRQAYEMSVQGFFEKGSSLTEIGTTLKLICDYWQRCKHPNS